MNYFKIIAFTHKQLPFGLLGKMHISQDEQARILPELKSNFEIEELMYLSTCNRIELLLSGEIELDEKDLSAIIRYLKKDLSEKEVEQLVANAEIFEGEQAVLHLLKVASSLESLVIGEREIITQVRKAYEYCHQLELTGDFIRLLIKQTIETAKDIYTHTNIAKNPVSVASLAYRQLRDLGIKNEARILFVGSGETNTVLANYFQKHKFANFTVFNRTLARAQTLAKVLNGNAFELPELRNYHHGFDVLIVCTGSSEVIITPEIFSVLLNGETSKKVIIDLSLPENVDELVSKNKQIHYIDINSIKTQAEANLQLRKNEIEKCEEIISDKTEEFNSLYQERQVELAFGNVPIQVKAIKDLALNEVFVKEINSLDSNSKEVLNKVLAYMEKKYNAVTIKTAKEVLLSTRD